MPELPEVETTRRGIEKHLIGRPIIDIRVRHAGLRWPVALPDSLLGQKIQGVNRRAKYLLLQLASGGVIIHLGMSGSLRILDQDRPAAKHDHVDLVFGVRGQRGVDRDLILRYTDPRRFGSFHYQAGEVQEHWLLQKLGVEPLQDAFSGNLLYRLSRGRKTAIKNFLMDQHVVVGVGNIYASEALFHAGIRPNIRASRLTRPTAAVLARWVKQTLKDAIRSGGTTLKDFTAADGRPGYFGQKLYVYGREGEPCRRCGSPIKQVLTGQRMSFYCPNCQR